MVSYKRDIWSVIHGTSGQLYTGHSLHVTADHVYTGQQVIRGTAGQLYTGHQVSYMYTVCQQVIGSRHVIHVAGGQ